MNLKKLQENWNAFGETDPLWSILTYPDKKGNKWEVEKFFETGAQEIGIFMAFIKSLDRKVQFRMALDFGCGVGRLSQALAAYFEEVHGVDIAPSMIELGKKYNRYGNRCTYHLNEHDDLSIFRDNSFDFIYSTITLHHMRPRYSRKYIREFVRILAPEGLLVFHLFGEDPAGNKKDRLFATRVTKFLALLLDRVKHSFSATAVPCGEEPIMEAYGIKREEVIRFLSGLGANTLLSVESNYRAVKEVFGEFDKWGYIEEALSSDPDPAWKGYWYIVAKN